MSDTLVVNEIYLSLQGESTFAGLPCIFVRLTACNLRCSYCDTAYAFAEGKKQSLLEVRAEVNRLADPFLQKLPVTAREPISALHSPFHAPQSAFRIPHLTRLPLFVGASAGA